MGSRELYFDSSGTLVDVVDTRTPDDSKSQKLAELRVIAEDAMKPLTAEYPQQEIDSWSELLYEARAFRGNPNSSTPWLESITARRGITKTELVAKIEAKSAAYSAAVGDIIGIRQALADQIDAIIAVWDGTEATRVDTCEAIHAIRWP